MPKSKWRILGKWLLLNSSIVIAIFVPVLQLRLLFSGEWIPALAAVIWGATLYSPVLRRPTASRVWRMWMGGALIEEEEEKLRKLGKQYLKESSSKVIDGIVVMTGVYGVLLAFVLSDKASIAFFSWGFLLWVSWILSIMIHLVMHMSRLIIVGSSKVASASQEVYYSTIFLKISIVFLIVSVAVVPAFSTIPSPTIGEITLYPWSPQMSFFSIFLCICVFSGIFFLLMNSRIMLAGGGVGLLIDVVPFVILLMISSSLEGPIGILFLSFAGYSIPLPIALFYLIWLAFATGWSILFTSIAVFLSTRGKSEPKKRSQHHQRIHSNRIHRIKVRT